LNTIRVEHNPDEKRLKTDGVFDWPVWTKEISEFTWSYEEPETCYILEGDVVVTPRDGLPVEIGKGDLVSFPSGMSCTWKVLRPVRKHYRFG
jgi:uncharacterized cupin superfamily protein